MPNILKLNRYYCPTNGFAPDPEYPHDVTKNNRCCRKCNRPMINYDSRARYCSTHCKYLQWYDTKYLKFLKQCSEALSQEDKDEKT